MASVCLRPDSRSPVFDGQSCTISIHFFFRATFLPVPIFMFQFFVEGLTFSADTWKRVVLEPLGLQPLDKLLGSGSSLPAAWVV